MDKLQVDRTLQMNTPSSSSATTPTSRPASRRTSTIIPRETLPTPPPDPRDTTATTTTTTTTPFTRNSQTDNIFVYPPTKKDLPVEFHGLLNYAERQEEFQKILNKTLASDCKNFHQNTPHPTTSAEREGQEHQCQCCHKMRKDCEESIEPLQYRLTSTITAALAAYGAIEQLNRMYSIWDQYLSIERELLQRKECLRYVRLLKNKLEEPKSLEKRNTSKANVISDNEIDHQDMEQSIALLETILKPGEKLGNQTQHQQQTNFKMQDPKQQRERSKSFMIEDMSSLRGERDASKHNTGHLLRRQSTYSDSKSKVSKWTKVKAAFKWERANVPALAEGPRDGNSLTPNNTEVARYLRVPSLPCGTSSADSVLSSSSGHLLSDAGTPGTISSASSMDDIDNASGMRRDSSKSDILENQSERCALQAQLMEIKSSSDALSTSPTTAIMTSESNQFSGAAASKSSSNKSIRKCKLVPDFEVLPEDVEAVIPAGSKRKNRNPPSPLNLNLKQDLNDPDHHYYASPHLLKASPQDGTQSLNRTFKKISSPVNSSVPSSPSRHSDFFAEFECEDISSGDFSEPNSPNHLSNRKSFEQQKEEVNRRYQILRAKLDKEFESKRIEWQKLKSNRAAALVSAPRSTTEPLSPNPSPLGRNISAKLLEENLTPDFKKKLQKWRVKKQASIGGIQPTTSTTTAAAPMSPTTTKEANSKIDWHLWKTGQLKLEGQGLSPLPDQKDLPEDFQKKLEQWNKIKRGGSSTSCTDSLKRTYKHGGSGKKGESDDDRVGDKDKRLDKHKPHDKEKSERLAKLKAIVGEHPAKEIQVKTSAGVMKFEGISRKFTRKLYEWEKARGIGPESSTFALLHPGYCPIDVKRISKESNNNENSPTLSRSLSLDSISPSIALPVISQQASSLSLNDVNELKEMEEGVSSTDALTLDSDFKKFDEPEAVMVEVEDHIVETASPLKLIPPLDKKQTPIYKYEEKTCKDFCNSRKVQSFESHTNLAPLLNVLKNSEELLKLLKQKSPEIGENEKLHLCDNVLAFIRSSYSYYADNLMKPNVLNAISDVQNELSRLRNLCIKSPLDEACCQEIMEERNLEYDEEIQGLHETLEILKQNMQGGYPRFAKDIVPDINIITDEASTYTATNDATANETISTTLEATDELSTSLVENDIKPKLLSSSNGIGSLAATFTAGGNGCVGGGAGAKKKIRLRKMGSRQNSKTESDSSDDDNHNILETPTRRLKRKNYRLKQRSFDEDANSSTIAEDMVYVLKVKPGQPIKQICDNGNKPVEGVIPRNATLARLPLATSTSLPNVFVKTKRKVFTTVQEPMAIDGVAVIEQEILNSPIEDNLSKQSTMEALQANVAPTELLTKKETIKESPEQQENYIRNLETEIKPRVLLVHKSISLDDVRADTDHDDIRKVHSVQDLKSKEHNADATEGKGFRTPLASDSFRLLNRNRESPLKVDKITKFQNMLQYPKSKKEHLFRKNNERQNSAHAIQTRGATIKKIENKIAKTNSGSSVSDTDFTKFLTPNVPHKMDNTVPRIARKLERKSLTPTSQQIKFDYPTPTNSEPTSPVFEQICRPMTPLNERALRLQKAKEEFLREKPSPIRVVKLRETVKRDDNWREKRQSDLSLSSTTADESSFHCEEALESEDNELHKSLSADTIRAESPPTQSDTGTDQDFGGIYDSIPRQVTRSGKISSKLGFATLASKLRRVKAKKAKDTNRSLASNNSATHSGSALTALCRQTIFSDIIVAPQLTSPQTDNKRQPLSSTESVMKSQSSPHAMLRSPNHVSDDLSRLNKSQSEQYVKRHKESYV